MKTLPLIRFRSVWTCSAILALLILAINPVTVAAPADEEPKKPSASPATAPIEARFTDGSRLKVLLKDEKLEFTTRYGKLLIPVADIRSIEFATRISDETQKRIDAAVGKLGSDDPAVRDAASNELFELRELAFPALLEAAKSKDPEVVRRAEDLIGRIREKVPEDRLTVRKDDVIHTEDSKITGRISSPTLKVSTVAFGERQVKLTDLVGLGNAVAVAMDPANVLPDPAGNALTNYNNEIGKTFAFRVTGGVNGTIWGTNVYTTDSVLATTAVHAGILKPGQTGVVKVMMLVSPPAYVGSTQNGVTSSPYGPFTAAYQFVK